MSQPIWIYTWWFCNKSISWNIKLVRKGIGQWKVRVIFWDISKAFDRIWHKGLLFKLEQYGITGCILKWFRSYLNGRSQRVCLNGSFSQWKRIKAGVPQGSILEPLLFITFINDIVRDIGASIKLFTDDTSLSVTVVSPNIAANILNNDLQKIHHWSNRWLVKFNPQKTETMVISRKTVKPLHPPLKMNNHDIQEVLSHKHLGIYFSDNGSWQEHIDYIVKKSFVRLNILRRFRLILDRFTLEKMYFSFIRLILEYRDVVWDSNIQYLGDRIEHVQIKGKKIVTDGTKLTSINKLYDVTGWEKLADRRTNHKLVLFHKMVNREVPAYLSNLLPDTLFNLHHHFTCRSQNISAIRARKCLYAGYYLQSSIKLWNELPL